MIKHFYPFQAQEMIKNTGNDLKLTLIKHGLKNSEQTGPTTAETEAVERRTNAGDDPEFFKSLADSVKGGREDWSGRHVKGGAFKQLQGAIDAGEVKNKNE